MVCGPFQGGWATCPITENGVIRIMSQPNFQWAPVPRSDHRTIADVEDGLRDDVSVLAGRDFAYRRIHLPDRVHHQILLVTDAYLLGLASKHGAQLVSFDRTLPWQAIRNGTARLVQSPLLQ